MSMLATEVPQLTEMEFNRISELVKELCGINLHDGKKELVKARLGKRLGLLGMASFDDYFHHVNSDAGAGELVAMLDALSTNLTYFFREPAHFDLLRNEILPQLARTRRDERRLRIWSAGCSSGEEPYSIAVTAATVLGDLKCWDAKILATDLSTRVLDVARRGVYGPERFRESPPCTLGDYFDILPGSGRTIYSVKPALRRLVSFARLNFMESWPMRGPFDVIFCRNVMIYFDKPTQERLVGRFWDILAPGGTLFIGHSESLSGVEHRFHYAQPTVYRK